MLALAKAFDTEGFSCCHTVQELGARLCVLPRLDHGLFGLPEPYQQNTPSLLRHAKGRHHPLLWGLRPSVSTLSYRGATRRENYPASWAWTGPGTRPTCLGRMRRESSLLSLLLLEIDR